MSDPVRLLVLYADKDIEARDELVGQLKLPIKQRRVEIVHRGQIRAGADVRKERQRQLATAQIIVMLVSADLLNDEDDEIQKCIERAREDVIVIPVLLRHVYLGGAAFGGLKPLPEDGVFLSRKRDRAEAWTDVVTRIVAIVEEVAGPPVIQMSAPASSDAVQQRPEPPRPPLNILCLNSDPSNARRLAVGRVVAAIDQSLERSRHRDRFNLEQAFAVTPDDLIKKLLRHRPTIVQFIGHGAEDGRIVLENESGKAFPVEASALARVFAALRQHPVRCVILDACYSINQAEAIAAHVDCVIGINYVVIDKTSAIYSSAIYTALADGQSLATAVELAVANAHLHDRPDADALEIKTRAGVDPANLYFV